MIKEDQVLTYVALDLKTEHRPKRYTVSPIACKVLLYQIALLQRREAEPYTSLLMLHLRELCMQFRQDSN